MIKLKSLLNINEQAPQPMPNVGGSSEPAQTSTTNIPQSPPELEQPLDNTLEPETDSTPNPEDPGEYDWTKDFRAFEDTKNRMEAQAKKKLSTKMSKQLVGKKITVNASRGQPSQPKTDYTINEVKKINVEFWYNEWVVIVQDENEKKYFLTPGVNIKIEGGANSGEESSDDQAPKEPEGAQTGATTGEEQPNNPDQSQSSAITTPPSSSGGSGIPPAVQSVDTTANNNQQSSPQQQTTQNAPVPDQQQQQQISTGQQQFPLKKKKKLAEWSIKKDLKLFLLEFMSDNKNVDFSPYIKEVKCLVNESKNAEVYKCRLEIPVSHMRQPLDIRDIKLAAKESLWSSGNVDSRFSRGSIDISKVGKMYIMEFVKQNAWRV